MYAVNACMFHQAEGQEDRLAPCPYLNGANSEFVAAASTAGGFCESGKEGARAVRLIQRSVLWIP